MQSLSSTYVRQPFAVTKCCQSKGKKTRPRRSKEERKMMVESFIIKYRIAHSGDFPSVTLTHKEVGGSFYTVREIVREIIQENKVLGPGSLSMESLTLDDYVEVEKTHWNTSYELSFSSLAPATDIMETKVASISTEYESENVQKVERTQDQQIFGLHQNVPSIINDMQDISSDVLLPNEVDIDQLPTLVSSDSVNAIKQTTQSHTSNAFESNSGMDKIDQLHPAETSLFSSTPEKIMFSDEDAKSTSKPVIETSNNSREKNGACTILEEDSLPEEETLPTSLISNISHQSLDNSIDSEKEVFPFETDATQLSNSMADLKRDNSDDSQQLFDVQNLEKLETVSSSSLNLEVPMVNGTENRDVLSSHMIDEETDHSTSPVSQNFASSAESPRNEAAPTDNSRNGGDCVSSKPIDLSSQDVSNIKLKRKKELNERKMATGSSSNSHFRREMESGREQSNPFLNAIKTVLRAVIKFWTE